MTNKVLALNDISGQIFLEALRNLLEIVAELPKKN